MANEVSRRQFLKGGLAAAAGVSLFGLGYAPKAAAEGKYTPGTYSAVVKGKVSDVTVTMTFDADSITDVKVDVSGETQGIGSVIGEEMEEALLSGQTWDVDAVAGATESSDAVRKAAAACVAQATGSEVVIEENIPTANADWLGEEPEIAESDIKAEYECDVLVIGAGTSGAFAACAAVEERYGIRHPRHPRGLRFKTADRRRRRCGQRDGHSPPVQLESGLYPPQSCQALG